MASGLASFEMWLMGHAEWI